MERIEEGAEEASGYSVGSDGATLGLSIGKRRPDFADSGDKLMGGAEDDEEFKQLAEREHGGDEIWEVSQVSSYR